MNRQLAKVTNAGLEIKDRGILTFWIHVDYEDGGSQGIGGLCLDDYNKEKKTRVGSAYGCEMIRRLLLELDVNNFNEMKGQIIWVHGEGSGLSFTPKGIERLKVDGGREPLIFEDVYNEFSIGENK
jgi:hypothetical protein